MRTSEDKSSSLHSSISDVCLWVCICIDAAFHFPSRYLIWRHRLSRPLLRALETIAFLFPFFVSLCLSLSICPSLILRSLVTLPPSLLLPLPWCTSSADTHEQPSRTHWCIAQPSSMCRCHCVYVHIYACVCCPAVSSETTAKLHQFVKSRGVWALRTAAPLSSR